MIRVIIKTPRKLKAALIRIAVRAFRHRVVMQVAIALGASVQPFTKITPSVSSAVMSKTGSEDTAFKKYDSEKSI